MTKSLKEKCDKILNLEEQRMKTTDEEEKKRLENKIEKLTMSIGIANINHLNQVDNYLMPRLMKIQKELTGGKENGVKSNCDK